MELFKVVKKSSLEVLKGFNNKMEAKKHRNDLQGVPLPEVPAGFDFIVSKGKDHPMYKGSKK